MFKSQHGLLFRDKELYVKIKEKILLIDSRKGIKRITELYEILDFLGKNKKAQFISQKSHESLYKVYDYLYNTFKSNITLEKIASHLIPQLYAELLNAKQE